MPERFANKMLVLGAGSVAQSVLPLLTEHVVDAQHITILDQRDMRSRLGDTLVRGAQFVQSTITRENYVEQFERYLSTGDFLLDLSWNVDSLEVLRWCHDHGVMYLNTSIEEWDPYEGGSNKHPLDRTLYVRHMRMRDMMSSWSEPGATAIVEHGANPGMVSHLVKKALVDIAHRTIGDGIAPAGVEDALRREAFNELARCLSVKVIHISECDTQVTDRPKQRGEFVNTWSIEGLYEEGVAPAELGWGTHERSLPTNAYKHTSGPRNQIALARPGALTWVRSWVPDSEIHGMVIRHGEAFTISDHLTVWEGDEPLYRPTVHYAYRPSNEAIVSLKELEMLNWNLHLDQRILNDEITEGDDRLGVLLMGHPYSAWWTGSMLDIHHSRRLIPGQSATTVQVASAVYAAVAWAIRNPHRGILVPDDLPWRDILDLGEKYWGGWHSVSTDWNPLHNRKDWFEGWNDARIDTSDPWQFTNFLVD